MPEDMEHSHLGMATDGCYIYVVTGQYGPQCRRPSTKKFVLDTKTNKWRKLPPLSSPRYASSLNLFMLFDYHVFDGLIKTSARISIYNLEY